MSWTRRRLQILTAGIVVAAWAGFYGYVIATSQPPPPQTAVTFNREMALLLAVPTAVYVVAALLALHFWLARAGARLAATDPPGRVLAAAVATLPEHRRDWGAAMTAELAEIQGRPARWWFALGCARAALRLPPLGGWPVLALVTGVVVAATVAARPAVGAAVPGLAVFAVSFVGLAGALVVLAVARGRRVRFPVPTATVLVVAGVGAAIVMTVVFLHREPSTAEYLPPTRAVLLAAVLAGCLWVAVASPRSLGTSRRAVRLGAGTALVWVVGQLLARRILTDPRLDPDVLEALTAPLVWLFFLGPAALFFVPALWAGLSDRSFRSGVQAGAWTAITSLPLTYALWLYEGLRIYPITGELVFAVDPGPIGVNLDDAVFFCLVFAPVVGIPCAVFGAAAAAAYHQPAPRTVRVPAPDGSIVL